MSSDLPTVNIHEAKTALHEDPFDRILLAQAIAEGVTLLTHDEPVAR